MPLLSSCSRFVWIYLFLGLKIFYTELVCDKIMSAKWGSLKKISNNSVEKKNKMQHGKIYKVQQK